MDVHWSVNGTRDMKYYTISYHETTTMGNVILYK